MTSPESQSDGRETPRAEELLPLVYAELRAVAGAFIRGERQGHTLQPTALVHEAFLRLADKDRMRWQDEHHFIAVAASVMRRVLVDHARRRKTEKRGGDRLRVTYFDTPLVEGSTDVDLLELDDALNKLATLDERQTQVVELRFFGGLRVEDAARILDVSSRTIEADWSMARAWLRRELMRG